MMGAVAEGTALGGGRYVLDRRLGRGGAATVWLAEDTVLERAVAVKVLSEAFADDANWMARFSREARLAARLTHPNLVSVYDFGSDSDRPYIVMEHMPGGSLFDVMSNDGTLDGARLARDVLSALEAIHAAGIIHRDIKPGNVLLAADETACLTDFGVARPEDATSLTQTGHIPGTGKYMAPELWSGQPADERSDLYAAGVLLRQVAGRTADPELEDLIARMTAENRDDRPATAGEALAVLDSDLPNDVLSRDDTEEITPTAQWPREPDTGPFRREEPVRRPPEVHASRPAAPPVARSPRRGAALALLAVLGALIAFALVQILSGGDDTPAPGENAPTAEDSSPSESEGSEPEGSGGSDGGQVESESRAVSQPEGDPVALNDEGYALLQAGSPEEAIPYFEQAVAQYPRGSKEVQYGYALYNLGDALVQAGRPEEAIPFLERRMKIDDGQLDTVQAKLDEARAAAE
jgi:eukaryotic-like serine/threonine-protein kinase